MRDHFDDDRFEYENRDDEFASFDDRPPRGGFDFDRRPGPDFDRRPHRGPEPDFDRQPGRGPERSPGPDFDRRPHRGPGPDFDRRPGPGRGPERGRHPGRGHGPEFEPDQPRRGRGPMPDMAMLKKRVADADLGELLMLCGRLLPRSQGDAGRGQSLVLSILAGREAISQRELQQMLGVQPGSLSELAGKLERKGYITRERGDDRRGNVLRITDGGRQAIPGGDTAEASPFSALTDDQQSALAGLLRLLLNDWVDRMAQG